MVRLYYLPLYLIIVLLVSCSTSEYLTPEELTKYITDEDNGLHKTNQVNDTKTEVTYRPTDLLVQQELTNETDTAGINKLRRKYSTHYYFIVSLSKNNKEALHQADNLSTYSDLVQTLSFRMADYVNLTTSAQDTIPVGDFMLNRTYGMSASTDILFVFNREKSEGKDWVQFNLNEFGLGIGIQRFRFRIKDLNKVPLIYADQSISAN